MFLISSFREKPAWSLAKPILMSRRLTPSAVHHHPSGVDPGSDPEGDPGCGKGCGQRLPRCGKGPRGARLRTMITIESLTKRYGGYTAADEITLVAGSG